MSIFVEELKKMQPPKMTFRSQIGPLIKSYECFMFLLNFRLKIKWTDGFLKDLNRFFLSILPPPLKTHTPHTPHFKYTCLDIYPPAPKVTKRVCVWRGGGAYPSRGDYTVFNIFIHIIKSWPDIFTIFTVFTQSRFESLWAYVIQYERNLSGRACECG